VLLELRRCIKEEEETFALLKFEITIPIFSTRAQCRTQSHNISSEDGPPSVKVAKWNWHHVGLNLTITAFIVLSGLAKVGQKRDQDFF
jgi:hypothetical protein